MRKIFAILIAMVMALSLFGCDNTPAPTQPATTAPIVETTASVVETTEPVVDETTVPVTDATVSTTTPEVTEQVIVTTEQYVVYLVGETLTLRLENLTDKTIIFQCSNFVVNDQVLSVDAQTVTIVAGASENIEIAVEGTVEKFTFNFDAQFEGEDTYFTATEYTFPTV